MTSEKAVHHEDTKSAKIGHYEKSVTPHTVRCDPLDGANLLFFLRELRVFVVKLPN